jgi:hypothetical protein
VLVNLADVDLEDMRFFVRERLDDKRVAEFAVLYRDGADALPPIRLTPSPDGGYLVYDGFHRCYAALKAGLAALPAEVWDTEDDSAVLTAAIQAAAFAPKSLTLREKRAAVPRLLAENARLTSVELAGILGVHRVTAATWRNHAAKPRSAPHEFGSSGVLNREGAARAAVRALDRLWDRRGPRAKLGDAERGLGETSTALLAAARAIHGGDAPGWCTRLAQVGRILEQPPAASPARSGRVGVKK